MAEKATIARPYARAAFEFANANGALADWSAALGAAAQVAADPRVEPLLSSPEVRAEAITGLVAEAAGAATGPVRNFLDLLAENGRLAWLPEIAAQYEVLRREAERVADVEVVSAMELDEAQKARLAQALRTRLGREVRMHTRTDASLIGGAIVRAGDLVIDGSLRGRLGRLASEMNA